jgi:phenylalanyl-tRNA synthetase beta chain
MDILTPWLRSYLPALPVSDAQLAEDLTLRGIAVEGTFPLGTEPAHGTRFEMDITTNRVDAMNHYGVAREAAAIYNVALLPLEASLEAAPEAEVADSSEVVFLQGGEPQPYPITIEAPDLCGRFTARIIRGVTVGPATGQLAAYFAALGQKPISAPVDATNFGWLAMGQPTHVFDLDTLVGGITVRHARAGETLRLLDGTERTLVPEDLVVADDVKALGLAGVMGGWDSRVTEATTNILVEAAWFDPAAIRASSRRHGLHTDASHRFERGADFNAAPLANHLVTDLILEQCGGEISGPLTDIVIPALAAKTADRAPIHLAVSEVTRHLGKTADGQGIGEDLIAQYLTALGCRLTQTAPGSYAVKLPSWRLDLEREIDLIEEVARVYGYNRFADTLPAFTGTVHELPHANQESKVRSTLRALGFTEAISSTFCATEEAATFAEPATTVPLGNPLSAEAGNLRPSLAPGMATMLAHNLHRDVASVRLFELGTLFTGSTAAVEEHTSLALGLTGNARATALYSEADALFYELKGALETLLANFAGAVTFDTASLPAWITPGRGARALLNGKPIALFGELSAAELQSRKLRQPCALATVDAHTLLHTPLRQPDLRELSRFQAVARDFSFLFPDTAAWQAIESALKTLNIAELQTITPLEIFRDAKGKAVPAGSYSLLLRTVFQSPNRTLTEDELTPWSTQIITALTSLGGTHRA